MQNKTLQRKRALRTALLVLLLSVVGMGKGYATYFDFSAVCPSGQTLYYKITDATNHYVKLTCPNNENASSGFWSNHSEPTGDVILPSNVNYNDISYTVTSIGQRAFSNCMSLTSITIPVSVTSIGHQAFNSCGRLSSVYYTGSIAQWCDISFYNSEYCNPLSWAHNLYINDSLVTNLTIPPTVTEIKPYAFWRATCITSLTIPNSVTSIGYGAFHACSGVSEVYYDAANCADIWSPNLDDYPFSGCSGTLTIGNNVERIPAQMFLLSNFTGSLVIPNSVIEIGGDAFYECSGFTGSLIIPNSVTTISVGAFIRCSGFTGDLIIPNSVTTISDGAFLGCSGFTGSLTIPNSVTTIENGAFEGCSGFTGSLNIPNSVTEIGSHAFSGCSGFTGNLTICDSVVMIGSEAFQNCGFTGVTYNAVNCANPSDTPFRGCSGTLTIGNHVERIPTYMFKEASFTGSLTIPNSVTEIGCDAFMNCNGISEVYYNAEYCVGPTTGSAFRGCGGVLNIGNEVESIPDNMFREADFTGDLIIPNSVTSIGNGVFRDCSGLTSLFIGNSLTSIGNEAFFGCNALNILIALSAVPPPIGTNTFANISPVAILFVPCGFKMAYFSNWNVFEFNNIYEDCNQHPIEIDDFADGSVLASAIEAQMCQEVQLTVTPNLGMELLSLTVCNATDTGQVIPVYPIGEAVSMYSFIMPPFGVSVMATFTAVNSVGESNNVMASFYPNPTNGQVKIEAENLKHITINNILGQTIYEGNASGNEFSYDFSKHETGIYLIRIETANGAAVKKVFVTR